MIDISKGPILGKRTAPNFLFAVKAAVMPRRPESGTQKAKRRLKKHVKSQKTAKSKPSKPRRQRIVKRRASKEREREQSVGQGSGHDCPICHEAYSPSVFPVVQAPCGHVTCASCSLQWQQKKPARTCALCRTPVLSVAHCALLEQLIDRRGAGASIIAAEAENSRSEMKQALRDLSKGDLNNIPADYRTDAIKAAAYRAIRKSDLEMFKTCIRDFKVRASTKLTCEVAENWRGDLGVIDFLLSCGARINGHREERPLVCAAQSENIPMLRGLLEAKADAMRTIGDSGETALHLAVRYGRFESVRALLDHGVPADVADLDGRTPLSLAEKGLLNHLNGCGMQPCARCEARIQVRGELRWRLGKSSGSSGSRVSTATPPPAPTPPDDAESEDSSTTTNVDDDPMDDASDVYDHEDEEEGEEEDHESSDDSLD